jgi:outer membrane protein assembly factor BamB
MMKGAAPLVLALALIGCASSPDPIEPPAPLTEYEPAWQVDPAWQAQLGSGAAGQHLRLGPAGDGAYVYAADRHGLVRSYLADTGRRVWSTHLEIALGTGPVEAGELLLLGGDAEVIALDKTNGQLRWRAAVGSEVIAEPVRSGNVVVTRTVDGVLYGLNAGDGRRLWRSQEQAVPLLSLRGEGAPVVAGEVVVAGFANGRVAAYALSDGRLLWETPIAVARGRTELERLADVDGRLVVGEGAVFAVGFQGRIAAVALANGRLAWSREMSSYQGLAAAAGELYVSDAEGNVWALAQNNGGTLWRQTALRGRGLTAPVVQGKAIVVGDYDGYLHWLARDDGHFLARTRVQNPAEAFPLPDAYDDPLRDVPERHDLLAAPVVAADRVFAADRRGALSVFRVATKDAQR